MSNVTHIFELTNTSEHHLISASPDLIITTKGAAGDANTYMASKWGGSNHVAAFVSGTDTIKVPLETLQELNASTAIPAGALDAANFESANADPSTADKIHYHTGTGVLSYYDGTDATPLLTLDGATAPTVAATDIEIV